MWNCRLVVGSDNVTVILNFACSPGSWGFGLIEIVTVADGPAATAPAGAINVARSAAAARTLALRIGRDDTRATEGFRGGRPFPLTFHRSGWYGALRA